MEQLSVNQLKKIASRYSGESLQKIESNVREKCNWKCSKGHVFDLEPILIIEGNIWCNKCSATRKGNIKELLAYAKLKDGVCLATKYINQKTKVKWQCKYGHEWQASLGDIKRNHWCPFCAGKRQTILDMHKLASKNDGNCLSNEFKGLQKKLIWQCSKGHKWQATPLSIKHGSWCPKCRGVEKRTIEELQIEAKKRNGLCLANEIINIKTHVKWKCELGHIWEATPQNVLNNKSWCPQCSNKKTERICREYFQEIFKETFPTKRPNWLINDRGNRLELDGFSEKLGIAFEYHGVQHFEVVSYTKDQNQLNTRINDDQMKLELCKEHKIKLFVLDYKMQPKNFPEHIKNIAKNYGIDIGKYNFNIFINEENLSSPKLLKEMQDIAKKHKGKLISKVCLDSQSLLEWECKEKHVFKLKAIYARFGNWCKLCGIEGSKKKRKHEWDYIEKFALKKGGKLITKDYNNSNQLLTWECSNKHRWKATFGNVRAGHWCKICSTEEFAKRRRLGLDEMIKIASESSGKCLSKEYINSNTPLLWECANGHQWKSSPSSVKSGSWCITCFRNQSNKRNRNITIIEAQELARQKLGYCLSEIFIDTMTNMKWKCSIGHIWMAPYNRIRKSWCPECARKKAIKYSIEDLKNYAIKKGGRCRSEDYKPGKIKLKWICKKGHQFEMRWDHVKSGKWCKQCSILKQQKGNNS